MPEIKYNFCPPFSAIAIYFPSVETNGTEIFTSNSASIFPSELYSINLFSLSIHIYLSYASPIIIVSHIIAR